jgi:hypothetical protein
MGTSEHSANQISPSLDATSHPNMCMYEWMRKHIYACMYVLVFKVKDYSESPFFCIRPEQ